MRDKIESVSRPGEVRSEDVLQRFPSQADLAFPAVE
jgi:hypothetical protein